MTKILFATDGSEHSKKAGETVQRLLKAIPDAEAIIFYATPPMVYPMDGVVPQYLVDAEAEYAKQVERDTLEAFKDFASRVRFEHVNGQPAASICGAAARNQVDLIVLGSHGRGALDRVLLGSVSHAVANRAKTSVLVVR